MSRMTPSAFRAWLAAMKAAGVAQTDIDCGRLLGVSADTMSRMRVSGTDRRTALACRALTWGLRPWGDD